jgi:hypothetical protein
MKKILSLLLLWTMITFYSIDSYAQATEYLDNLKSPTAVEKNNFMSIYNTGSLSAHYSAGEFQPKYHVPILKDWQHYLPSLIYVI